MWEGSEWAWLWDWMEDLTTTDAAELSDLDGVLQGITPNVVEDD
ncbi:hypothetical protein L195_g002103 [Trifolium pratense]|uniref:Uncharacterized protein n=1 Tax=Trifolium pratense TaxID=57577 RepID=A0A2K3NRI1_TRIPR|nr:hypothetical protein L195_g002103 [Trifolium pratense]